MNFKQIREAVGAKDVDQLFGLEEGTLDALESGELELGLEHVKTFNKYCPLFSLDWLINQAFKQPVSKPSSKTTSKPQQSKSSEKDKAPTSLFTQQHNDQSERQAS